ncbi:MAG: glutamate formimidoyltransferase [Deltaproteobacteria bacterium]|nr:glutamate formimidoyltransferase [Deltaproteobacteria bacterium]
MVECVPNFSEGRDRAKIDRIASAIASAPGVRVLNVDPDPDYNRVVITFVGGPATIGEGAFRGIREAGRAIDMTSHKGNHPRMGATDVCPFVPVRGVTMDECVRIAQTVGRRTWEEAGIPVYLYERAARTPSRQNLADVRRGEYEGLAAKLRDPDWRPDFGPPEFNARSGATIIGARPFLIAWNVNLASDNLGAANEIARRVRESGRVENGHRVPGRLKSAKAIGVMLQARRIAQVSMNLTDFAVTPPHVAFDACREEAAKLGEKLNGSELVGLIPKEPLLMAGRHASGGADLPEEKAIAAGIEYLGLAALEPFAPEKKVLEIVLEARGAT